MNNATVTELTSFSGYGTFMAVVGTIGNLLSLAVALRPKVRGNSFSIFLGSLAFADSLVLWAQAFLLLTYYNVSRAYCVTRPFFLMYPEAQANWIIAGLTFERAVLIAAPMKASALGFGKQRSGLLIVGFLVVVVLAFHLPTLFFLQYDPVKNDCVITEALQFAALDLYPWLTVVCFFYLPMFVIIVCNVAIIRNLLVATSERAKISPGSSTDKATQRVRRIAVTVSVVSVVYVVLEFCNTLIRTQLAVGVIDGVRPPPEFFASMMACQTNHGINIILYCLSGEQFRREFFGLLRWLCCIKPTAGAGETITTNSSKHGENLTITTS